MLFKTLFCLSRANLSTEYCTRRPEGGWRAEPLLDFLFMGILDSCWGEGLAGIPEREFRRRCSSLLICGWRRGELDQPNGGGESIQKKRKLSWMIIAQRITWYPNTFLSGEPMALCRSSVCILMEPVRQGIRMR